MDYARLRAAALRDGEDEEAVTVDTRALIDKVLARYSGEWTTLRELIQNAADAQATTVSVKWETLPSTQVPLPNTTDRSTLLKHTIVNHTARRLVVQNDGQPFTNTDWGRLKRIAEGNPDETKIGAFGVGFYSVFADCEEPFVSSGAEAMAFYWKGNALFTKKSHLPADQASKYTAFVLDYRNSTTPVPNLLSIAQFLATSLTFVALQNIEFWIDDHKILSLKKKSSPSVDLVLPRDLEARTKEGLMKVVSVDRTSTQIDASYMNAIGWKPQAATTKTTDSYASNEQQPSLRNFFARLTASASHSSLKSKAQAEESQAQTKIAEDITKLSTSTIFLRATSANISTNVTSSFASELERATKKPPPKVTKLSILTSSHDEAQATASSSDQGAVGKATDVFASVLPHKKPGGRIFIGFPTMQTTGAGMHVSAPSVIPTVEREAIDLNARWVKTWNIELLRAAGIVARLSFAHEMEDLNQKVRGSLNKSGQASAATIQKYLPEAFHALNTFTFGDSTPSGQVGQIIEEAFWTCFRKASIEMFSSCGVLQTSDIRLGSNELSKFVDRIPVVVPEMLELPFVKKLIDFGLISSITVTDIRKELESKALSKTQMTNFISWAGTKSLSGELDPASRSTLLDVAVGTLSDEGDQGGIVALCAIQNFLVTSKIPASMPLPPTTLPFVFSVNATAPQMQALGWEPLDVLPWLRFLLETASSRSIEESLTQSPKFAVQVLVILSKNWDSLPASTRATMATLLQGQTIVPTKQGMRKPAESFFPSVKLFDDLPVIQGCEKVKEKFLNAIGVRKTVDLDTIFTRLLQPGTGGEQKWSHMELIKYLASVQSDIPNGDLEKLRNSQICPAEAGPKGLEPTKGSGKLYKVSELFEPKDTLRALQLPILQWLGPPGSFRPSSAEGRFLALLGLRPFPSVPELVEMMASKDESLRISSMSYFTANHQINRYSAYNLGDTRKAIMPLQGTGRLVTPAACFTNERASILGYDILRADLHAHALKFGVARDPPIAGCVQRLLANPPKDHATATTVFAYFSSRSGELAQGHLQQLRKASIVPVSRSKASDKGSTIAFATPSQVYLGTSSTYGDIFDFVDFGPHANPFLFQCGAKSEPTKPEVALMACTEPARLLGIMQSPEKYLDLLKSLADASGVLRAERELWRKMKSSPFLLAYKELASSKEKTSEDDDEAPIKQFQLASASQIVVVDDFISYQLFKDHLMCAPEDDTLETFYHQLGAPRLSSIVDEDTKVGSHTNRTDKAEKLRKHVFERSKIFLFEYGSYRKDHVKHDSRWLEKNLTVVMVRSVALRRTLKGQTRTHTEKRSATIPQDNGACILYVADEGKPDMYQVGQALCQVLLHRPNQQAYLFFEPFLTLDLLGLRARGYNVDRILRAKAAEARIAEEHRQIALEAEQKKIQEQGQTWSQQADTGTQAAEAAREAMPEPPVMPGSWDSPENKSAEQSRKSKGLFSNWTKRLGLDSSDRESEESHKALEQFMNNEAGPSIPTPAPAPGPGTRDDGRVTSPAVVQQNLLNAVNATRAHGSDKVFSEPKVNEIKEQATYCDKTPAHNIAFAAEASNGVKVYVDKGMAGGAADFLSRNHGAINAFANILVEIGGIYSLSPLVLHIFVDEAGGTIAFNTGGSIFCNLRFFLQLHSPSMGGPIQGKAKVDAATWWWVVIAHELAHNLVSPHNADHSYYTESFIQQYMGKMMAKVAAWTAAPAPPPTRSTGNAIEPPPPYISTPPRRGGSLLD